MRIDLGADDPPEIGLAPLIDCVFLLLIFFLVATSFERGGHRAGQDLPIDLPASSVALDRADATPPPLVIGVDKAGGLYWQGESVSTRQLHEFLRQAARADPHRRVRIDGDRLTAYENIVHVLDLCQFEGFTSIGVHTWK
jgi:biopolymer transport protein ExbD